MNGKGEIVICLTVLLNIAHNVAIAQGQPIDEEALARRVVEIGKDYWSFYVLPENARERLLEGGIALEQAKEMIKGIIHKNLLALEKMRKDGTHWDEDTYSSSYRVTGDKVRCAILMLKEFPSPDTLALLREYALSRDDYTRSSTVHAYIAIAGGDSVPFLQEVLARKIIDNHWLAQHLRRVIRDLKKEGRDGDVEKLHVFLLDQIQTEQDWLNVNQLDTTLCETLDGYAQSIQRKQAMQRFPDREDTPMANQRRHELQSEIDAIPAGKLIDITRPLDGNARKVIAEYNERKATAEKDKRIAPLLLDMQVSQDPVHLAGLDRRLRVGLGEDYAHSIQRAQFIQKISGSEIGWIRDQYNQAKAEIDAVPADKRTDLSKRFKLAEPKTGD